MATDYNESVYSENGNDNESVDVEVTTPQEIDGADSDKELVIGEDGFIVASAAAHRRALSATAELQAIAAKIADGVFEAVRQEEDGNQQIVASTETHNAMDSMVMTYGEFDDIDLGFLVDAGDAEIAAMLKSQTSKRSRLKKATMTRENYFALMNACISELLLRKVAGKPKGARVGGAGRSGARSRLVYTEEELVALGADQEAVRREMKNLASKKSTYKNGDNFDEASAMWANILEAESQLKSIRKELPRGAMGPRVSKIAKEIVALIDEAGELEKLTKDRLVALIDTINGMCLPEPAADEEPNDTEDTEDTEDSAEV